MLPPEILSNSDSLLIFLDLPPANAWQDKELLRSRTLLGFLFHPLRSWQQQGWAPKQSPPTTEFLKGSSVLDPLVRPLPVFISSTLNLNLFV